MIIDFDPNKREITLRERGLDFERAGEVFSGVHTVAPDHRHSATEARFITVGVLDGREVVVVWTERGTLRRVISMRKANEREQAHYQARVGRP